MSLNRAVVALGAVAVVGVATLGFSIPYAAHNGKPVPNVAVLSGSTWMQIAPKSDCYDGGKPLSKAKQALCSKEIQAQLAGGDIPTLTVNASGTYSINVDQLVADKGWLAADPAGVLVQHTKEAYAGPLSVESLMAANTQGSAQGGSGAAATKSPVLVIAGDGTNSGVVYGQWLFQVKVKGTS
jgi:hypothetical protein